MKRKFNYEALPVPDVSAYSFRDVLDIEEVSLYGLYKPYELRKYCRIPDDVAKATSPGVGILNYHSSGGRIRFATDSEKIAVRFIEPWVGLMPHMTLQGSSGIDIYLSRNGAKSVYFKTLRPQTSEDGDCVHEVELGVGMKDITLYLPLYNSVDKIELGILYGTKLYPASPYKDMAPIVYYGSSITQGGCASRPGLAYQARICRSNNIDYRCLGFSGSAKGEDAIVEYMSELKMSAFVSDYDHNAPSADHLRATHEKLYKAIRKTNPDIPYIIVGKPDVDINYWERRDIVFETYTNARHNGDAKVYYVDSYMLFGGEGREDCTVDGCHPNDIGFERMANAIGSVVNRALGV